MKTGKITFISIIIVISMASMSCSNKKTENNPEQAKISVPMQRVRLLPVEGAYNVRDLGGYTATENKTVKWGKVIRSGDLNLLTENDLVYMAALPLKTFIDFRDYVEVAQAQDQRPASLINYYNFPIETGNIVEISDFTKITEETAPKLLVEGYKRIVKNNQSVFRQFFEVLQNSETTPLLFHCSAGKDRTGLGAALFLASLGVDRELIIEDYLLSNDYLEDKYAEMIAAYPVIKPVMEVRREYIEAAFETIDNEYGGMDNYLTNYLGVDIKKMQTLYTE